MSNHSIFQNQEIKLKCLVVDDEAIAIKGISNYIQKVDFLHLVATASSAQEAMDILEETPIDILFLDINMPKVSGLELLESLTDAPLTIFTTAYSEYALDGFRLHVVDYLMKPIPFQRFYEACQLAKQTFLSKIYREADLASQESYVYIRQGDSFEKIDPSDIIYVEGMQNYLKLHLKTKNVVIHQTMSSLEELLPQAIFFRTHRSYLINMNYIHQISGGQVAMSNGDKIAIAKPRRQALLDSVVMKKLISK